MQSYNEKIRQLIRKILAADYKRDISKEEIKERLKRLRSMYPKEYWDMLEDIRRRAFRKER